mmetsp:Transcript_22583/g.27235  ORF Transcript_22583/g.27235 Transcript_22583/m.27235 type:complete len:308 (+) Transcript_22583:137-1060(+)
MSEQTAVAPSAFGFADRFTRLSKLGVVILTAFYVLSLVFPVAINYVALVPGKTLPCVWNILTASFVETDLLMLIVNSLALLLLAKYLEPVWGSKEFLKFIVVVATTVGLWTFTFKVLVFVSTQSEDYLYGQFCGFHGVIAGFMVAVKQLMPDHDIKLFGVVKLKIKNVPMLLLIFSVLFTIVSGKDVATFVIFGTYGAWLYLRYYQDKPGGQSGSPSVGDPTEAFSLASFFPEVMKPVLDRIGGACEGFCCSSRAPSHYSVSSAPLPGSDMSDSVRRRERGARALEERLAAMSAKASEAEPTGEENA